MPDSNNVYGTIVCTDVQMVLEASQRARPWERAYIYTSGYSGARTVHLRSESAWFDSDQIDERKHLFNGAVAGEVRDIVSLLTRMSREFELSGVGHSFEVYDAEGKLVATIPGTGEPSST
jgi:hypothetical protein